MGKIMGIKEKAFKDLKLNFANTAFYKDILRECTDFGDYVNRN